MRPVAVCGSMNMDVFGYVERLPRTGQTVLGSRLAHAPGGKGANQAVAAARAGAPVSLLAALAEERPLAEAVRFRMAAASLSVQRPATQPAMPDRAEIERLLG